jgi:Domain of unknown function (DUF5666)
MNRTCSVIFTGAAVLLAAYGGSKALAGIQGSGRAAVVAFGPIAAFGSVFVNGVEYSIAGAQIVVDGQPGTENLLSTGQVVTVQGDVNDDGITGTAMQVSFTGNVRGRVTEVDDHRFAVLGQSVRVTESTIFGEGTQPLQIGMLVEVSGLPDASGAILASRLDVKSASTGFQVVGTVQWLDTNAHTFRINDLTVDYGAAPATAALADGSTVEVLGTTLTANGALLATDLEVLPGISGAAGEKADIEGVITDVLSLVDFIVDGQHVTIDASTLLVLHGITLGPDVTVDVKGEFDASGTLHARKVEALPRSLCLLAGVIDSISPLNNALSVLGINIKTSGSTILYDRSSHPVRQFGLTDLHVGDYVEVCGAVTEGSVLDASRLERRNVKPHSSLEGVALNPAQPDFTILGVTIATTAQTRFTAPGGEAHGAAEFFAQAANHRVKVEGNFSGGVLTAQRAQIER